MFKDEHRCRVWEQIRQQGLRAFDGLLTSEVLGEAGQLAGVALGSSALGLPCLVALGLMAALKIGKPFAEVLIFTLKLLEDGEHWASSPLAAARRQAGQKAKRQAKTKRSKHDPYGGDPTIVTEEAFVQARQRMPLAFWTTLMTVLVRRFEQSHGAWMKWGPFRLLALDGSTLNLPDWAALRGHYGSASNGGRRRAQARMVMLQSPLTRMPFRYELGTLSEGERAVAARLLVGLAPDDLVLIDQGFWSYALFWQVQNQSAYFAIRKYPGVRFKTVRRLGAADRLVEWTPSNASQRRGLPRSIRLRVIDYQIPGFRPSAVVTNVLEPKRISRGAWVHLATKNDEGRLRLTQGLYHRRWEIETTFFELKVTQGMEGALRSRTPQGIAYEVAGHMLLYLLIRWLIVEAAETAGADPLRISFKGALGELLDMQTSLVVASPEHVARVLLPRLLSRIASHLVLFRPGRSYPRPHDGKIKNKGNGKVKRPHKLPTKRK